MAYSATEAETKIKAVMAAANAASSADEARNLIAAEWASFFTWLIGSLEAETAGVADTGGYSLQVDVPIK